MEFWTDGYVTALPYTARHHAAMMPWNIALSLLAAGIEPPALADGFTYCELGFGRGFSLALAAAANPKGRFYGNDFNPAHAREAATLAEEAGLPNLSISGEDFAGYLQADLPAFDIIALHGIWSWVGPAQRQILVEFLRRHLKPAGIVYLGHNVLPGWSQHLALRRFLLDHVVAGRGSLGERIDAAIALARRVAAAGGGYFAANPQAVQRLESMVGKPTAYLAHEFFNESWEPHYSADVATALAPAGLLYAAPATLADLHTPATLSADARALLAQTGDPIRREGLLDMLTNQPFRRDIFARSPRRLTPGERKRRLAAQPFLRLTLPEHLPSAARLPKGEIPMDRTLATGLLDALADGPAAPADLAARIGGSGPDAVVDVLLLLAAAGHVAPCAQPPADDNGAAARFNRLVLERALRDDDYGTLACVATGGGLDLDRQERLFLLAWQLGRDPISLAEETLTAGGQAQGDGRPMNSPAAIREEVASVLRRMRRHRGPVLAALGVPCPG